MKKLIITSIVSLVASCSFYAQTNLVFAANEVNNTNVEGFFNDSYEPIMSFDSVTIEDNATVFLKAKTIFVKGDVFLGKDATIYMDNTMILYTGETNIVSERVKKFDGNINVVAAFMNQLPSVGFITIKSRGTVIMRGHLKGLKNRNIDQGYYDVFVDGIKVIENYSVI